MDSLPHTNTIDALHSESHIKESIVSAHQEQRMVKSEHGSPLLIADSSLEQLNGQLTPLDFAAAGDYAYPLNMDNFSAVDSEAPIFSAGLSATPIDWSHYDGLDFNSDSFATSNYSQAPSFTGFDFSSIDHHPALTTTSTSGEVSEVEDFAAPSSESLTRPTIGGHQYGSDYASDYGGDMDKYRLSTPSSYVGLPQAQILAGNNVEAFDLEEFMKLSSTNIVNNSDNVLPIMNGAYSDGTKSRQANSPFDGLPVSDNYSEDILKTEQSDSPFDESTFQLLPGEDIDWSNAFSNNGVVNIGETVEGNIWAAQ